MESFTYKHSIMKALFLALANELQAQGIKLKALNGEPHVASSSGPWGDGFYFRKSGYDDWTDSELATLRRVLPFRYGNEAVSFVDWHQTDSDDDRIWAASFTVVPMSPSLADEIQAEQNGEFSYASYDQMCMIRRQRVF